MPRYTYQPEQFARRQPPPNPAVRLMRAVVQLALALSVLVLFGAVCAFNQFIFQRTLGLAANPYAVRTSLPTLTRTPLPTLTPTAALVQSGGAPTPAAAPVNLPPTPVPARATTQLVQVDSLPATVVAVAPPPTVSQQAAAPAPAGPQFTIEPADESIPAEPTLEMITDEMIDNEIYVRNTYPTPTRPPTHTPPPYLPTSTRIPFVLATDVATATATVANPTPGAALATPTAWSTPTPRPTRTPLPTATATPVDTNWSFAGVRVDGNRVYGMLTNTSGSTRELWFIAAGAATHYDSWPIDYVDAGESIPFVLSGQSDGANLGAMGSAAKGIRHRGFEVSDLANQTDGDSYCVTGAITGPVDELEQYLVVALVLYDGDGRVINFADYDALDSDELAGGEPVPLLLCAGAQGKAVDHFDLKVWGR